MKKQSLKFLKVFLYVTLSLYIPFSWILFVNYSWSYKWNYIKVLPWFPGMFYSHWLLYLFGSINSRPDYRIGIFFSIFLTILFYCISMWLGIRSRKKLIIACIICFITSIFSSLATYGCFVM